jgi:uncharacterized circularly permuted ATP-grasp superfamily protein
MGIELVEGRDLIVDGGIVYMKTIHGLKRVDVIYRRVDDEFLDSADVPAGFRAGRPRPDGRLPRRNVALANAVGNGVADDKAIYAYVPTFIRYYLGEDPILRSVETYLVRKKKTSLRARSPAGTGRKSRGRIRRLRDADGADGGSRKRIEDFRERIKADPRNYIAQPVLRFRACLPTIRRSGCIAGRHVDLRPYCLYDGEKVTIVPGGLTRVALQKGSLVVNSSQGGGSKDTWVLAGRRLKCCRESRNRCSGWLATSSGRRTPRAFST